MNPSLLIIQRTFPPDPGAVGHLVAELATALADRGWHVRILAGPAATDRPDDPRFFVQRVRGLPFTRKSHWRRALSYLSLYPALLLAAWRAPEASIVLTTTDPPLQAVLGAVLRRRKTRAVHWSQDIYPELAEAIGPIRKGGLLAKVCRSLSTWSLRKHDAVVPIGQCMAERLAERGVSRARLHAIPNWVDCGAIHPVAHSNNPFRRQHGLADKFVVGYSGNFGLAHTFTEWAEAAAILQESIPRVVFLLIGEGPRLAEAQALASRHHLKNVQFLPPQPRERLALSLSAVDLHLVTMRADLSGLVVPSKFYSVLAAGRPCLFVGPADSEVARQIRRIGCGAVLTNGEGESLAREIAAYEGDAGRWERECGRAEAAAAEFSLGHAVESFLRVFRAIHPSLALHE